MLAQSLQAPEQDGFINRVSYPVLPPHVEYTLTDSGCFDPLNVFQYPLSCQLSAAG